MRKIRVLDNVYDLITVNMEDRFKDNVAFRFYDTANDAVTTILYKDYVQDIRKAVLHVDGDKVVDIIQHSDLTHCSVSSCVQRSSFPMALRGSGCALNSVTMRLYSGRPRLTPVTNSFTVSCFAGSQ